MYLPFHIYLPLPPLYLPPSLSSFPLCLSLSPSLSLSLSLLSPSPLPLPLPLPLLSEFTNKRVTCFNSTAPSPRSHYTHSAATAETIVGPVSQPPLSSWVLP